MPPHRQRFARFRIFLLACFKPPTPFVRNPSIRFVTFDARALAAVKRKFLARVCVCVCVCVSRAESFSSGSRRSKELRVSHSRNTAPTHRPFPSYSRSYSRRFQYTFHRFVKPRASNFLCFINLPFNP